MQWGLDIANSFTMKWRWFSFCLPTLINAKTNWGKQINPNKQTNANIFHRKICCEVLIMAMVLRWIEDDSPIIYQLWFCCDMYSFNFMHDLLANHRQMEHKSHATKGCLTYRPLNIVIPRSLCIGVNRFQKGMGSICHCHIYTTWIKYDCLFMLCK